MTKLFTLKNLACAGAVAFAMTLVTAPQVDAAVTKLAPEVDYANGILYVDYETKDNEGVELIKTADGTGIYFGSGSDATKAAKKMTLVTSEEDPISIDISKLFGKETAIHVAADEKATVKADIKVAAAPAFKKIKLENGQLKYTIGSGDVTGDKIDETYYISYKKGVYGEWCETSNDELLNVIKSSSQLGTTLYVKVAGYTEVEVESKKTLVQSTPWSKEVKLKVAAKAKAPKVAIKTALTKAFGWKSGDKVEYILTLGADAVSGWTAGSKESLSWTKIVENAAAVKVTEEETGEDGKVITNEVDSELKKLVGTTVANYVKDDAVSLPVQLQVRTKADDKKGKPASSITVVNLAASPASPTNNVIKVEAKESTKKNATTYDVTISPGTYTTGYTGQYSTDGTNWKALKSAVTIDSGKLSSGVVYVRQVCADKKDSLLASPATKITITQKKYETKNDKGEVTKTEYLYAIVSDGWKVATKDDSGATEGTWIAVNDKDYTTPDTIEEKTVIQTKDETSQTE